MKKMMSKCIRIPRAASSADAEEEEGVAMVVALYAGGLIECVNEGEEGRLPGREKVGERGKYEPCIIL